LHAEPHPEPRHRLAVGAVEMADEAGRLGRVEHAEGLDQPIGDTTRGGRERRAP
jgi:hypothetical protein